MPPRSQSRRPKRLPREALPSVFIGSSKEAQDRATMFAKALARVARVTCWWDNGVFPIGSQTLSVLTMLPEAYDFGVFLLTPDDKIEIRGTDYMTARDNVLFELGLFLATMGADRAIAVLETYTEPAPRAEDTEGTPPEERAQPSGSKGPRKPKLVTKSPSDLEGLTIPRFKGRTRDELAASIAEKAAQIAAQIQRKGRRRRPFILREGYGTDDKPSGFFFELSAEAINRRAARLAGYKLAVVARLAPEDTMTHFDTDPNIAKGQAWPMPQHMSRNTKLWVRDPQLFAQFTPGMLIQGALVLMPPSLSGLQNLTTFQDMLDAGCIDVGWGEVG